MHEPVQRDLENYLSGGKGRVEVNAHLNECRECQQEVLQMEEQAMLMRELRAPADLEPSRGFYARVMERIEAQRAKATFWSGFLEPAFAKRLALASVVLVVLLSAAAGVIQRDHLEADRAANHPEELMAAPTAVPVGLADDPDRDRNAVLVNLTTYSQPVSSGIQ